MSEQIEGKNPVLESLRAGHELIKIYIAKGDQTRSMTELLALAAKKGVPINQVDMQSLNRMAVTRNHQGVIAVAAEWKYASIEEILQRATQLGEPPFVVLLDGVEDPQNLGSIIRTAEAAGVHGLIIPDRRAVGLNATVSRASAGAIEYLPVARVTNLTKTIDSLKQQGLWFTAAEMEGELEFGQADLAGPMGLVVGGEGNGVSRLVREHCDQQIRLPMWGKVNSLNVSVAAGILMYEVRRQRLLKS